MSNYIEETNKKYQRPIGIDTVTKSNVFDPLVQQVGLWSSYNNFPITDIKLSGSRAKGTAISLTSDLDIFISLSSSNTETLGNIFNSLYNYFNKPSYNCRKQNVSVGITYGGMKVDLVPGCRQSQYGDDHSLYKSRQNTWTKTNIDAHINIVKDSSRIPEIVAAKIWRHRHTLDFPSIFLELVTINALKNKSTFDHDSNFLGLLEYFCDNIHAVTIIDPANSNNIISNDLTLAEKRIIANQAGLSRNEKSWSSILW